MVRKEQGYLWEKVKSKIAPPSGERELIGKGRKTDDPEISFKLVGLCSGRGDVGKFLYR